jgi:hypothetical protein
VTNELKVQMYAPYDFTLDLNSTDLAISFVDWFVMCGMDLSIGCALFSKSILTYLREVCSVRGRGVSVARR